MNRTIVWLMLELLLSVRLMGQRLASSEAQKERITLLISQLRKDPWPGAENICSPICWQFGFSAPMKALLKIGRQAQNPLLAHLFDPKIMDQIVILLGGVGDEHSVGPIIQAMKIAAAEPISTYRKKVLTSGNIALTNITVSEVIWNHGGGIPIDACPNEPADCWSTWWQLNETSFHVSTITQSRRYVNYPNYGVYEGLP